MWKKRPPLAGSSRPADIVPWLPLMMLPNCLPMAFTMMPGAVWYAKAISKNEPACAVVERNEPRSRPMHSMAAPASWPSTMPAPVEPGMQFYAKSA